MALNCTRCEGSGFLNAHLVTDDAVLEAGFEAMKKWWEEHKKEEPDFHPCDCCGDCESWHGEPGEHYGPDDPQGRGGPYEYNGGLCECH